MTTLEEALDTLKDRLGNGGKASDIVNDTACEYGLHPSLLRRKFEERYGAAPEGYVPPISLTTLNRRRARRDALHWAWWSYSRMPSLTMDLDAYKRHEEGKVDWIADQVREHHLGAIFKEHGREFAFAGLSSSREIVAIPVEDGEPKNVRSKVSDILLRIGNPDWKFATLHQAYEWLEERIEVGADGELV